MEHYEKKISFLGENIQTIRKHRGMKQQELADKIGINMQSLSKIERGVNYPTFDTLEKIMDVLGVTPNELLSGEWKYIDHQLLKSKEQGYYIETPKTKSGIRQVPLSRETIQAFQRVMKKRPKAEPFVIDGQSNFLFVNHKGKPKVAIDYNALFVRMVKKYNKHHKDNPLPHITPHTLRHTFCTRLASKNMNPKDLQYIMGHSNISITMNWYAHASIDTAKSEVQRLIA
jgi:integrase